MKLVDLITKALLQIGLGRPDRSFAMYDADSLWAAGPHDSPGRDRVTVSRSG